ncbi:hypothetical protein K438DRAFT_1758740 [Mycena galopus ATCC 62051]|nr:hypothetical protein K438DRAFT_1758740 [Mycena galopus ATCC 62051]
MYTLTFLLHLAILVLDWTLSLSTGTFSFRFQPMQRQPTLRERSLLTLRNARGAAILRNLQSAMQRCGDRRPSRFEIKNECGSRESSYTPYPGRHKSLDFWSLFEITFVERYRTTQCMARREVEAARAQRDGIELVTEGLGHFDRNERRINAAACSAQSWVPFV